MIEQMPLDGFENPYLTDVCPQGLFRRESDRATGCMRHADTIDGCSRLVDKKNGILPVTIFTLGRFSLLINGSPRDFGRKVPRRPLELLKAVIAQGGREICISRLTLLLWPDVDGDKAMTAFNTTLHRLRKILGDERVLVLKDSKLSLDARYCWVDVWVFERLLGGMTSVLKDTANTGQVYLLEGIAANLCSLYQDHFLVREEPTNWSISMQERLRSKFIHSLIEVGRFWEQTGRWERAIECYRKGIDVDDLVEVFYQRLMNCYLQTHRLSEGMSIYRRCRQTLSIMLSLQPESDTESLYLALKDARSIKQSA